MKKVLAICGSTRTNSSNLQILKVIQQLYKERIDIEIFDAINQLPHFNPDLDNEKRLPVAVDHYRNKLIQADGVIICTPEYVFSLPGSLKNALEWTIGTIIFDQKPVALITASGLGAQAHESLLLIMKTMSANFNDATQLHIKGARSKINEEDGITDQATLQAVNKVMENFIKSMNSVN